LKGSRIGFTEAKTTHEAAAEPDHLRPTTTTPAATTTAAAPIAMAILCS
jgi:hypothetical protein